MNGNTFHRYDHEPHFWVGYLAARIKDALNAPENARSILTDALRNLRSSPVCTPELAAELGGSSQPQQRPVPMEPADWGALWRPCANPECNLPLPRKSTKLYCDAFCRKIALEHMNEAQPDEVPY